MNFQQALSSAFKNYADFSGRSSRPEYWYFYLFILLVNIALEVTDLDLVYAVFSLVTFIPLLAVGARRLHDVNRSGWWQLLAITIIGLIPLVCWLASPPVHNGNRFLSGARDETI